MRDIGRAGDAVTGRAVGIDLGTTMSAVGVVDRAGWAELVRNTGGQTLTPSVVLFTGPGQVLVGATARNSAVLHPDDCVQFIKREMGNPHYSFIDSHQVEHRPEQVSAYLLRALAEGAAEALGEPVRDVVITVPAYFDDTRRKATADAAEIAGLNLLRLVNEPTAAAISYGVQHGDAGTVLVYDLGGGTFDVTVMRVSDDGCEVIATDGDRNLGGFDFDNALMRHVAERVAALGGEEDLLDDPYLTAEVRERCELAKTDLSQARRTVVRVGSGRRAHAVEISREEFEAMIEPYLHRTEVLVEGLLEDAGLTWDAIDRVLPVGGSTRIPAVRALLEKLSGKKPDLRVHPDEAVCLGAAHLAAQEAAAAAEAVPVGKQLAVRDVTSQSMGIVVTSDDDAQRLLNDVVIARNTPIPAMVERTYRTVAPDQDAVSVQLTEGEGEDLERVNVLTEQPVDLPPGLPAAAPLRLRMSYDVDGLVHAELFDETHDRRLGEIQLERPLNLDAGRITEMRDAMSRTSVG
ncbi:MULTISPECIES: Hsp70 family protein [Streptomyces]|uniref:Hsp70 family protein n=1 Tax=Streptomyces sp. SM12 TaxID=1071602 RepID=UPI0027D933D2|nr:MULTISPECIES: Hsp70 family protein [Streptomyces]